MKYRADIDGLRAIAVLSVIFYHLGFTTLFGSGFTGVDIFFVISGYLITSIIYKEMLEERFSFLDFYERRVRRIFPIFLLVIFSTLCFAYFIDFYDIRNFINSLFSTLIMGGNFYFWKDSGYFDLPSHMKPLLHTWSLGVEEQFYIIFPVILIFLLTKRLSFIKKYPLLMHLCVLWLISFIICILQSYSTVDTAFYLLPYRFWELLTGSIFAIYGLQAKDLSSIKNIKNSTYFKKIKSYFMNPISFSSTQQANIIGVIGLILIIFSVTLLTTLNAPFPSYIALFPCLGTALCIEAGKNPETFVYKFLSLSILKNIGKISFSLYLWHWVVIVFAREVVLIDTAKLSLPIALICLGISFVLSIISYFIIEQPIRRKIILKKRKNLFTSMFIFTLIIALFALAIKTETLPRTASPDIEYYNTINYKTSGSKGLTPPTDLPDFQHVHLSFFGAKNKKPTLMVIGDSHARMFLTMLDKLAKEHDVAGIAYHGGGGYTTLMNACSPDDSWVFENNKLFRDYIDKYDIKALFISFRFGAYRYTNPKSLEHTNDHLLATKYSIIDTINFFSETNPKVFIKLSTPEFPWHIPQRAARVARYYPKETNNFRNLVAITYDEYINKHKKRIVNLENLKLDLNFEFINLTKNICDNKYCYGTTEDGTALYYDDDHLTIEGTELFRDEFLPFIFAGKAK